MPMPRKTVEEHRLNGTWRRDRHGKQRAMPDCEIGPPPRWLSAAARKEWKRLTEHPIYGLVLTSLDRDCLSEYLALRDKMIADAEGTGKLTATERQSLTALRDRLGLSPGARRKVEFPEAARPGNKFTALKRQREIEAMTA